MTCSRCQGCMAKDHFIDIRESGGDMWAASWRCLNCGNVFDPVVEQNRRLHSQRVLVAAATASQNGRMVEVEMIDLAA